MPILYACVAKQGQIIADYSLQDTGMTDTVRKLISKIPPGTHRKTYKKDEYHFHYVAELNTVFFCLTEAAFSVRVSFAFLDDIKSQWTDGAGASFRDVLSNKMAYYSKPGADKIAEVQGKVAEVKDIMLDNIESVLRRGEQLETLDTKAQQLQTGAKDFKSRATTLARTMWWKNFKIWLIIIAIVLV